MAKLTINGPFSIAKLPEGIEIVTVQWPFQEPEFAVAIIYPLVN